MIDLINRTRAEHILTVEDPVEFVYEPIKSLVHQRQLGEDTKSFANALKAALREDPDIILVGEMRDLETIALAISAAETGHLVFGTLHTSSAAQTVDRIIDVFPSERQTQVRVQLSNSLVAVFSQTLVPKKNPKPSEYGRVMAFSGKTLFNGDNIGLQTYSVVRVFDHIVKVLFDFLNRRAFENWNSQIEADLRRQIVNFLDSIKGPNKLIDKFRIVRFERDPKIKDRIYLDIRITPYFPAKSFVIRLDGRRGDDADSPEWTSDYSDVA
jgi:hypothetical protein